MPSRRRGPEGAGWLPPLWRDGHKGRPYNSIFSQLRWPGLCQAAPLGLNAPTPRVQPKIWVKISPREGAVSPTSTHARNDAPLQGERVPDEGLYRTVQTEGGRVRGLSIQWDRAARSTYGFGLNQKSTAVPPSQARWVPRSAVAAATAFLALTLARLRYESMAEGGSCCYRTPRPASPA